MLSSNTDRPGIAESRTSAGFARDPFVFKRQWRKGAEGTMPRFVIGQNVGNDRDRFRRCNEAMAYESRVQELGFCDKTASGKNGKSRG